MENFCIRGGRAKLPRMNIVLGITGGIVGIVGGMTFNYLYIGERLPFPMEWIGLSFLICAGIGGVAGLYPALRAANENVIDALRYE